MAALTDTVARGAQAAVTTALEKDPEVFLNLYIEGLRKRGLSDTEIAGRVNQFQAAMSSIERLTNGFNDLGLEVAKYRQQLYQSLLDSHLKLSTEQAAKSTEAFLQLARDLNTKYLETEQAKLDAKISPYKVAGSFAGFLQVAGMVMEAFSPGSGRDLIDRAEVMIKENQAKIDAVKLNKPDSQMFMTAYQDVQRMIQSTVIDVPALSRLYGNKLGDTPTQNGAGVSGSTDELLRRGASAGRGEAPGLPTTTIPRADGSAYDVPASGAAATPRRNSGAAYDVPPAANMTPAQIEKMVTDKLKSIQGNVKLTDAKIKEIAKGYVASNADANPALNAAEAAKFKKVIEALDQPSRDAINKVLGVPSAEAVARPAAAPVTTTGSLSAKGLEQALAQIQGLSPAQAVALRVEAIAADTAAGKNDKLLDTRTEIERLHNSIAYKSLSPDLRKAVDANLKLPEPAPQ